MLLNNINVLLISKEFIYSLKDNDNKECNGTYKNSKRKGKFKKRPVFKKSKVSRFCPHLLNSNSCSANKCKFEHDLDIYMEKKESNLSEECIVFQNFGYCPSGFNCRFDGHVVFENKWINKQDDNKWSINKPLFLPFNIPPKNLLCKLRKREQNFEISQSLIQNFEKEKLFIETSQDTHIDWASQNFNLISHNEYKNTKNTSISYISELKTAFEHSKQSDFNDPKSPKYWKDQTYLAPLTTLGNLPFRRVCKKLGADITCGEMALASSLLQGNNSEWALLKRHHSEDKFGIQICGNHVDSITKVCELISELTLLPNHDNLDLKFNIDFVDLNMGCPIDDICAKGGGATLMRKCDKVSEIVRGMRSMLLPHMGVTIKVRTGIKEDVPIAHKLLDRLSQYKYHDPINNRNYPLVSLMTIHGRSKNQRYTKRADWDYINKLVVDQSSNQRSILPGMEDSKEWPKIPIFGCGDVYSQSEYYERMQTSGIAGIMIGRGALIKPWIFTEIKERRDWDISANERLDILREFTENGLQHWGSDTYGVETTRRFLLEWLSFTHRYVPLGIIETYQSYISETIRTSPGPKILINDRPPIRNALYGRNDLERLMSSPDCKDWIKISKMLLGPPPDDFVFLPKHKSNSYSYDDYTTPSTNG